MDKVKTILIDKSKIFAPSKPNLLTKLLPIMLIASFIFANFYYVAQDISPDILAIDSGSYTLYLVLELGFYALLDYAILLLVLWLYRSVLSYRPYFYLVKVQVFNDTFKFWYFVRNVLFGTFACILFIAPYFAVYLPLLELILSFLVVLLTYFSLKKYVDIMFRHMYFKLLLYPWFILMAIETVLGIIFGGV